MHCEFLKWLVIAICGLELAQYTIAARADESPSSAKSVMADPRLSERLAAQHKVPGMVAAIVHGNELIAVFKTLTVA